MTLVLLCSLSYIQFGPWFPMNGRMEPVSIAALAPRKPNRSTILSDDGKAMFLDHTVRYQFENSLVDYLSFEEPMQGKLKIRGLTRRELYGPEPRTPSTYRTSGLIQFASSGDEVLVIHYTGLQIGQSGEDAPRRGGISKVKIGSDWSQPFSLTDRSQPVIKYLPGMFGLRTLLVRRTPTNTFRIEVREGNKRLCEIPVATNPGLVSQFDDQRLRMLARVKTQGDQKFGLELVNLRPYKRTRLPAYPQTRALGPVSFLRDGRILAAFSVKVGTDPKLKGRFPGATDEVIRDVIALFDPKKSKWQKVADGTLWCSSASGSVMLVGDENPTGKQWLFWPKEP